MTMISDHGERFEVVYHDDHDGQHVFGWANTISAAFDLVRAIVRHPAMRLPQIIDRGHG